MLDKLAFLFVSTLVWNSGAQSNDCTKHECQMDESLRFFVLGDWGGLPVYPYYTIAENYVADGMAAIANQKNTHFQLALGDNFYVSGVKNAEDDRFENTFEDVFHDNSMQTPWYILAGNHDHYGNVTGQIAYTKKSHRWVFPSLYYSFKYKLADATDIDFVYIDTVSLCGNLKMIRNAGPWETFFSDSYEEPVGPENVYEANIQWKWLEQQLAASKSKYLFVAGHFPVYSVGEHGPTPCLVDRLQPLLYKYNVSAYLSGHDHSLQHLQTSNDGWTTSYVITGCGAFLDSSDKHMNAVPVNSLKYHYPSSRGWFGQQLFNRGCFSYVQITSDKAQFTFYKGNQHQLYQFSIPPRRF